MNKYEKNDINDLLGYYDTEFVKQAYLALFMREVDPSGLAHYTQMLRKGHSKIDVLKHLFLSSEYKDGGVHGLEPIMDKYIRDQKLAQLPIIGKLIKFLFLTQYKAQTNRRLNKLENLVGAMASGQSIEYVGTPKQTINLKADLSKEVYDIFVQLKLLTKAV